MGKFYFEIDLDTKNSKAWTEKFTPDLRATVMKEFNAHVAIWDKNEMWSGDWSGDDEN